jgi:phage baseplate assembly protein W
MIKNYQVNVGNALWVDVNTRFTQDHLPDRVVDDAAIWHSSLYNLLNCMPGQRARIFQPEYGSSYRMFLQEPINDVTAAKMQMLLFANIAKWEPRVNLRASSRIEADTNLPGYKARLDLEVYGNPLNVRFEIFV